MTDRHNQDAALAAALREREEAAHAAFIETFTEEGRQRLSDREVRALEDTARVVEQEYGAELASQFRAFIDRYK